MLWHRHDMQFPITQFQHNTPSIIGLSVYFHVCVLWSIVNLTLDSKPSKWHRELGVLWENYTVQVAQLWQRDRASSINDFRWGWIWGYYRLRSYFSRHCDTTQFTLTHHMVNKPFLLLGLAAEYRSRRRRRRCANNIAADHHMFITLAGQLSWQRLRRSAVDLCSKAKKIALWATL